MRVIYSANNRLGSGLQLFRFLQNIPKNIELKTAAYLKSSKYLTHVDFILDPLATNKNFDKKILYYEIERFEPDLIVTDIEPFISSIAKELKIKLWYCSPILLFLGTDFDFYKKYKYRLNPLYKELYKLPEADKVFIYSPFGDIFFRPQINYGYNWVSPYYTKPTNVLIENNERKKELLKYIEYIDMPDDKIICSGETSYVTDCLYNNFNLCMIPSLDDQEALMNSILIKEYNIGENLAQVELMGAHTLDSIQKALSRDFNKNFLNKQNNPLLHEALCQNI